MEFYPHLEKQDGCHGYYLENSFHPCEEKAITAIIQNLLYNSNLIKILCDNYFGPILNDKVAVILKIFSL